MNILQFLNNVYKIVFSKCRCCDCKYSDIIREFSGGSSFNDSYTGSASPFCDIKGEINPDLWANHTHRCFNFRNKINMKNGG